MKELTEDQAILLTAYTGFMFVDSFHKPHELINDQFDRRVRTHELDDDEFYNEVRDKLRPKIMEIIPDNEIKDKINEDAE